MNGLCHLAPLGNKVSILFPSPFPPFSVSCMWNTLSANLPPSRSRPQSVPSGKIWSGVYLHNQGY